MILIPPPAPVVASEFRTAYKELGPAQELYKQLLKTGTLPHVSEVFNKDTLFIVRDSTERRYENRFRGWASIDEKWQEVPYSAFREATSTIFYPKHTSNVLSVKGQRYDLLFNHNDISRIATEANLIYGGRVQPEGGPLYHVRLFALKPATSEKIPLVFNVSSNDVEMRTPALLHRAIDGVVLHQSLVPPTVNAVDGKLVKVKNVK